MARSDSCILACFTTPPHLGKYFIDAARDGELTFQVADTMSAWRAPKWMARLSWRLLDKRPPKIRRYAREVERLCIEARATKLLSTGLAPVDAATLRRLGARGVVRGNYSTDDPWNPTHRSSWFLRALPEYDVVFNPRRANMADFREAGCRRLEYVPFAYDREQHFPEEPEEADRQRFDCDVAFIGGADVDRLPHIDALREGGLNVRVFGSSWDRYPRMRSIWGGALFGSDYRRAVAAARVNLCLVRRANRDGHVMRTFELGAMRATVLAEDTGEHREIYGEPDDQCVRYFRTLPEMVTIARQMVVDPGFCALARTNLHRRITGGQNTYADRFAVMMHLMNELSPGP